MKGPIYCAVLVILSLFTVSCQQKMDHRPVTLHIGNDMDPPTIDPHLVMDNAGIFIDRGLFEGLVRLNLQTLEPEPAVAEGWEVSDDGLVYTFHLRGDARWNDGRVVRAQDFVDAVHRVLNRAFAAPMVELLKDLKHFRDFTDGRIDIDAVGISAVDDSTLRIELERPVDYFLSLLTHPIWSPIRRDCLESFGSLIDRSSAWTRPGHMVSNGPFQLRTWRVGDRIELTRNRFYWDNGHNGIDALVFYPLSDRSTEENAFFGGLIDITASLSTESIDGLRRSPAFHETASLSCFYYILNCDRGPLNDGRIRRALSLAIDRGALCDLLHRDRHFAAQSLVPPHLNGYEFTGHRLAHDPELARRLLAEAGFPGGKDFPVLRLVFNDTESRRLIAQAVQEMWRRELGINVRLESHEWKMFVSQRRAGNFDVARGGWIGDYGDPMAFLELFMASHPNNLARWSNADYDTILRASSAIENHDRRRELLSQAEDLLLQEMPIVPLYFETNLHLVSPAVEGWVDNPLDYHLYQYLRKRPKCRRNSPQ